MVATMAVWLVEMKESKKADSKVEQMALVKETHSVVWWVVL